MDICCLQDDLKGRMRPSEWEHMGYENIYNKYFQYIHVYVQNDQNFVRLKVRWEKSNVTYLALP